MFWKIVFELKSKRYLSKFFTTVQNHFDNRYYPLKYTVCSFTDIGNSQKNDFFFIYL